MARSLKNLKAADVQRNLAVMKQMLHEVHPTADVGRGPLHDLVLYPSAAYTTALQQDLADAMKSINLGRLVKDPNAAPTDMVDRIMSNWKVHRKYGTTSSGIVTVVLEGAYGMVLPAGFTVMANGHKFITKETYTVRTATGGAVMQTTDRALRKQQGYNWTFTIPVVAIAAGASGNLRRGAPLGFESATYRNIRNIYATTDFTGGADEETNAEMLQRLNRSASGKIWSNRCTGEALLCGIPALERAAGVSIVGFGDPEMLRDRHSFWPGSVGGRVDVYVKPLGGLLTKEVTVKGKIHDGTSEGARWELDIQPNWAPGFLRVEHVHKIGGGKCSIVNETRGMLPTSGKPDIPTPVEAVYSAYQTSKLLVLEPGIVSEDKEALFTVTLSYLPGITEAQQLVLNREVSSLTGDVLVKAAIPCFLTLDIDIQRQTTDQKVRVDAIREAVATAINNGGFVGRLPTTTISNLITPFLDGSMVVRGVNMVGMIRYPNGKTKTLQSNGLLIIPNDSRDMVSPRTTVFFQDPTNVNIRVITADDSSD